MAQLLSLRYNLSADKQRFKASQNYHNFGLVVLVMQTEPRFRHNLSLLRHRAGLTQRQLAERLGLKRSVITSYEGGKATPSVRSLLLIARFFSVTLDELVLEDLSTEEGALLQRTEQELHHLRQQCQEQELVALRKEIAYREEILRLKEQQTIS